VTNNISVKGEYLYEGFGRQRVNFANVGATRQDLSDHIVRVGVNYKF
jgi:opacity protein-like surface antigen